MPAYAESAQTIVISGCIRRRRLAAGQALPDPQPAARRSLRHGLPYELGEGLGGGHVGGSDTGGKQLLDLGPRQPVGAVVVPPWHGDRVRARRTGLAHRCRYDEERVDSLRGDVDEHHPLAVRTGPSDAHAARSRSDEFTDPLADLVHVHRGRVDPDDVVQNLFVMLQAGGDADDDDPAVPVGERRDILGELLDRLGVHQLARAPFRVEPLRLAQSEQGDRLMGVQRALQILHHPGSIHRRFGPSPPCFTNSPAPPEHAMGAAGSPFHVLENDIDGEGEPGPGGAASALRCLEGALAAAAEPQAHDQIGQVLLHRHGSVPDGRVTDGELLGGGARGGALDGGEELGRDH